MDNVSAYGVPLAFAALVISLFGFRARPVWAFSVAVSVAVVTGAVDVQAVVSKAGHPAVVLLALLVILSRVLSSSMTVATCFRAIEALPHRTRRLAYIVLSGGLSAFVNNTGIVAVFASAFQTRRDRYRYMLPIAFAATMGGMITLVGGATNIIVSSSLLEADQRALGMFEFAPVGLMIFGVGAALLWWLTPRTLSRTVGSEEPVKLACARVLPGSTLIGREVRDTGLVGLRALYLAGITRQDETRLSPVPNTAVIAVGDVLTFAGDISRQSIIEELDGLERLPEIALQSFSELILARVSRQSPLVGQTLRAVDFRAKYNAVVVQIEAAITGDNRPGNLGEIVLAEGDVLTLMSSPDTATELGHGLETVSQSRVRDSGTRKTREIVAIGFGVAVMLSAFGVVSLLAGVLAVTALAVAARQLTAADVRQSTPLELIVIVVGALSLGHALAQSDAGTWIADILNGVAQDHGLRVAMFLIVATCIVLTEFMTNAAAAAIMAPLAITFALSRGLDPAPFALLVAYGSNTSFLTPYGHQTTLIAQSVAGYQWKEIMRTGLVLTITSMIIVVWAVPWLYGL